jgi:ketosteroid isomerase-like protein
MRTNEDATTQQRNNETVRRLFAAFTANDAGAMDELLAPEFAAHGLPPELGVGAAAMKGTAAVMHAGLHDCHCEIEDLIAQRTGWQSAIRPVQRRPASCSACLPAGAP